MDSQVAWLIVFVLNAALFYLALGVLITLRGADYLGFDEVLGNPVRELLFTLLWPFALLWVLGRGLRHLAVSFMRRLIIVWRHGWHF